MGKQSSYTKAALQASQAILSARAALSKVFAKDPPFMTEKVKGRKEQGNVKPT